MDPVSALSIAACVVQFLDFGRHILSASYEIYRSPSGQTAKVVEITTISKDLTDLVAQIKDKVGTAAIVNQQRSGAENQLIQISEQCEAILTDLQGALNKLEQQSSPTTWAAGQSPRLKMARGAIRKALANVWSSSALDQTSQKLEKMKDRLVTATLFCLW